MSCNLSDSFGTDFDDSTPGAIGCPQDEDMPSHAAEKESIPPAIPLSFMMDDTSFSLGSLNADDLKESYAKHTFRAKLVRPKELLLALFVDITIPSDLLHT